VRSGGQVAILMPQAAASRRPGRRIRGNLLRAGALRAVVTLAATGPDLWLLRRPDGQRPPSHVLIMDASDGLAAVEPAWRAYLADPESAEHTVRIIDLLDDEVDLSPASHRPQRRDTDPGHGFEATRDLFLAATAALAAPALQVPGEPRDPQTTTIGELVKAGLVTVHQAPLRMALGDLPMLTAEDVARGAEPSGLTSAEAGLITTMAGDVVSTVTGTARVLAEGGAALGPQLTLYRVDLERIDPDFLAGFLRAAGGSAPPRAHSAASRMDARRTRVPRVPLAEQRMYGAAFRELAELDDRLRETAALGGTLIRLGLEGLVDGRLWPCD
jgi:hypothetical protein